MILKVLTAAIMVLLFAGCEPPHSKEFTAFVEEHGSDARQYCSKDGFLTEEKMLERYVKYPDRYIIRDSSNSPIRCAVGVNGEIYE